MNKSAVNPKKQLPSKSDRHELFGSVHPGPKSKPVDKEKMSDLQNSKKDFLFAIDAVGISNVKNPIKIVSGLQPFQQTTIGTFTFTSRIDQNSKGTNMSRFTEQLNEYYMNGYTLTLETLKRFTKDLADRLQQHDAALEVAFPWFFEREGPSSGLAGLNHADANMKVSYDREKGFQTEVSLSGKVTTLCPCSKDISEYSAHNQRGNVSIVATLDESFDENEIDWKETLLEAAESNASARIHPVLKRPDEKMVTEQAYENPRFVEDMVRLVAADLYELPFVKMFSVSCRNEESIHLHDAVASLTYDKSTER